MSINTTAKPPGFVEFFNPLVRRILHVAPILGPNALITIRGRKSGKPRTTPVAVAEINGERWVIGTFGEVNWVQNLRSAGRATLTLGSRREEVTARELVGEERALWFRDVLAPYARKIRVGPALLAILGAREVLEDPVAASTNRPVFELRRA